MYSNADITQRHRAIGIEEIRDISLHIIADAPPPNWLRIDNAPLIPKVTILLIPGLTTELLSLPPFPTSPLINPNVPIPIPLPSKVASGGPTNNVSFIASTFSHACPTRAPGDQTRMHSVLNTFFTVPISATEKKKREEQKEKSERLQSNVPAQYLLTIEQMIEHDYPLPSYMADVFQKPDDTWVEIPEEPKESLLTAPDQKKKPSRNVYSLDCEMCMTEDGKELTRVCIIDFRSGIVIYDQLVKPSKPITDYLTRRWSGITAEALAPVTTTLSQVQAHLLRILSPPATDPSSTSAESSSSPFLTPILLGHSLESDLRALKLCHPFCIDTAVIFHHPRGRPLKPGLAWLTKKWCGREIQTNGEGGHDPEEDARACIDLLKKKLDNGPTFGEFKTDYESIFERMARSKRRAGGPMGSIKGAVIDHGNPSVMHGNKATTSIGCKDDDEVLKGLLEVIPSHHFVFARFMALANILGWTTPKQSSDSPPLEPAPPPSAEQLGAVLDALNLHLKELHSALPSRTALIIFTGHSDPRRMAALNARKAAFEAAIRSGKPSDGLQPEERWTAAHVRELESAVEMTKRGLLFLGVKP
ncbi:ribonuclease H-like protein [Guyanagaster necrorhizus]|uniref:Ribonuclease H-like protein n=1 Tax=Guyanagaster necrorhizus TaxID=856835 RepID=A0A9P7W3S3_9AGAR|nr:ribonuclease H-like protein [Guyanagaster necrorhizus MCA 3950]KAG7452034.1 ribonuclease H-like protein [Guyanagaster necrorhizus MCA 3950]